MRCDAGGFRAVRRAPTNGTHGIDRFHTDGKGIGAGGVDDCADADRNPVALATPLPDAIAYANADARAAVYNGLGKRYASDDRVPAHARRVSDGLRVDCR